jgi:hypothetical protein
VLLLPPDCLLLLSRRWVRSIAFDPSNDWFCTGSSDRTIKLWETGTGQLKLTLTGHIEQVTGLAVSPRHPYMFSCSLDKEVKCWDLEHNKVGGGGVCVRGGGGAAAMGTARAQCVVGRWGLLGGGSEVHAELQGACAAGRGAGRV